MLRKSIIVILIITILITVTPGYAQSQTPNDSPTYIVQSGDTLSTIAQRFGVPVNELIAANNLADPNAIALGMPLIIPGLQGISGTLITQPVPLGETFDSMAARYQVPIQTLARLNRVTSPQELFAGASLVLPKDDQKGTAQAMAILTPGQSVLEASAEMNVNPWTNSLTLQDSSPSDIVPGNILYSRQPDSPKSISVISPLVKAVQINPLPIVQGKTTVIRVQTTAPVTLSGQLAGKDLHFFQEKDNSYVALQGVYAMANPGLTPFSLSGAGPEGIKFDFQEMVILKAGYYPNDPPLTVDPATIDPAVTKPEEDQVFKITAPSTPSKYWNGKFHMPVADPPCYKSTFGNRRAYNGGPYSSFHGGTDFGVCVNLDIYSAGDGVVVFAGPLTVRGNATIIDHGWGVYSGYWHQKEIKIKVGDHVKAGQLIGQIGATGRVTGPHLHFEMIINGIQVEPVDWLQNIYP